MGVSRGVAHGAPEPGNRTCRPHVTLGIGVLTGKTEVQEIELASLRGKSAHGEIGWFDIAVQET